MSKYREGSLEAPVRHPLNWQDKDFYNEQSLNQELERVFDICHGCRRCVSLCKSFPTYAPTTLPSVTALPPTLTCANTVALKLG